MEKMDDILKIFTLCIIYKTLLKDKPKKLLFIFKFSKILLLKISKICFKKCYQTYG